MLWSQRKIQHKLLIIFSAVLALMALVTVGFYVIVTRENTLERARDTLTQTTQQHAASLQYQFDQVLSEMSLLTWSPLITAYVDALATDDTSQITSAEAEVQALFSTFIRSIPIYDQVRFIDATGMELVRVNQNVDGIPTVVPAVDLQDKSAEPYFPATLALGPDDVYISPLNLNRENGLIEEPYKPMLRYSTLIHDDANNPVGMIVINVATDRVLENLLQPFDEAAQLFLIDQDGTYLVGPDADKLFGVDLGTGASFAVDYPDDFAHITGDNNGSSISSANHPNHVSAFSDVTLTSTSGTMHWYLVMCVPHASVLSGLTSQVITSVLIVFGGLIVVIAAVTWATNQVASPLQQMTQAAQRVSNGDWDTPLPPTTGNDEVALLSTAFDNMLTTLRTLYDGLEDQVADRTTELREANKQLQEIDLAKSRFVADVAHELRTPITVMMLKLDLLQKKPQDSKRFIKGLERELGRMRSLVEGILDLSRLDALGNKRAIDMDVVKLNDIIDFVVDSQRMAAEAKSLQLRFEPDPALPVIIGNRNQISQVIENLVSNAIKYTPSGTVMVRTNRSGPDNNLACIDVEDTGMGIPPEEIQNLWDRFYRSERVRNSEIPGTGLGLSIVKEIVELHQGTIAVHSQPGQGTTVKVAFPPGRLLA